MILAMRGWPASLLVLVCCSEPSTPRHAANSVPEPDPPVAGEVAGREQAAAPDVPFAAIRERSGCAFESTDALCAAFREHYRSAERGWVSEQCTFGEPRVSRGAFAEVRTIEVREGQSPEEATTQAVLATRVGNAWFPMHVFHPTTEGEIPGNRVEWDVLDGGTFVVWEEEQGASRRGESHGYGETERTIAAVDRGVPMIAARATIEWWRRDGDSSLRETRSWERDGSTIRLGATELQREGSGGSSSGRPQREAETRRLDVPDGWLSFCGFTPVVRAVAPSTPSSDPESVAARERARAAVSRGTFRDLRGAAAAAVRNAPVATLEIYETLGSGCGGGGCTTAVRYRTIEGPMPEQGVDYFTQERGSQVGCDPASMPEAGETTFVQVAPAVSREAIGCGFSGFDGTHRRYWVVLRVLEARRP